jgi:hypothetical protein
MGCGWSHAEEPAVVGESWGMLGRSLVWTLVSLAAAGPLAPAPAPAGTPTDVWVPAGTRVALTFVTPVDSAAVSTGAKVRFKVSADVVGGRYVIIRAGRPVMGTVTKATQPGIFGASSEVVVGFLAVTAVDGRPISLQDVTISKSTITSARAGAAGASAAGAIILGPVGLLAGALVKGDHVNVPAGTVVVDTTTASVNVRVP